MTLLNVDEVKSYISQIPFVKSVSYFEQRGSLINGKVEIAFKELAESLEFEVVIFPQYPLRSYDSESIKFINRNLIMYNHVMGDGSVCIHTSHQVKLRDKLLIDFTSLKNWIVKYYINKDGDLNYEHIVVPESLIGDGYTAYIFTDVDHKFKIGEFGNVDISFLNVGFYKEKPISSFIVQSFTSNSGKKSNCKWSELYKRLKFAHKGFYIFIENTPAKLNRFAFDSWIDLNPFIGQEFLSLLHGFQKRNVAKNKGKSVPIFIGYETISTEIHWQVAILEIGRFPLRGLPEKIEGIKTGKWKGELIDAKISWALSRNSSYEYFFGRGTLSKNIITKRILILGIGAVGSMVATTLVRGGCKFIDLADYDVKEPENVCRSEYLFDNGINEKVKELSRILTSISPFVEIASFKEDCFETLIKVFHKEKGAKELFTSALNQYDVIFDCTTDNDLMYILDSLELNCDLINLSITNHAKDLICAFYPNIYKFVENQFGNILDHDLEDLFNPTGCWSPTFKASYNDINVLVQMAIKHINILFEQEKPKNNFILKTDHEKLLSIEIKEY
jgi:hypothetical protein